MSSPFHTSHGAGGRPHVSARRLRVNLTMRHEVHAQAARLASQDHRSLSGFVELCLCREIERLTRPATEAAPITR